METYTASPNLDQKERKRKVSPASFASSLPRSPASIDEWTLEDELRGRKKSDVPKEQERPRSLSPDLLSGFDLEGGKAEREKKGRRKSGGQLGVSQRSGSCPSCYIQELTLAVPALMMEAPLDASS